MFPSWESSLHLIHHTYLHELYSNFLIWASSFILWFHIMWMTYIGSWMTTCMGKSCSFGLPCVPFVNYVFSYFPFGFVWGSRPTAAVLCPWARHFTPRKYWLITQEWWLRPDMTEKLLTGTLSLNTTNQPFGFEGKIWDLIISVPDHCLSFYLSYSMFFTQQRRSVIIPQNIYAIIKLSFPRYLH